MEDASKFIAQGPTVFTNPLLNNQNMNSRTIDRGCASGGNKNLLEATRGHGFFNMVCTAKVVTHAKYYGSSQPELGEEPSPPKIPLRIEKPTDKPKAPPHIQGTILMPKLPKTI